MRRKLTLAAWVVWEHLQEYMGRELPPPPPCLNFRLTALIMQRQS